MDLLNLGYAGVFLLSFTLNMLPFMSPSNFVLAGALAFSTPWTDPLVIGLLVALASSSAKLVHFYTVFFLGKNMSPERIARFEQYKGKTGKIGSILLFLTAASPIPDEPIVIPLGLIKFNPMKFFVVFLSGKLTITVLGAFLGAHISLNFIELISNPVTIIISLSLTIIATYIMMKVDLELVIKKLLQKMK
jgi:uncharacterized membrane protein YdjX (TVP38/TMEM64 family)